ncbi:unnamed protein product [Rhodiola kirilowii]
MTSSQRQTKCGKIVDRKIRFVVKSHFSAKDGEDANVVNPTKEHVPDVHPPAKN